MTTREHSAQWLWKRHEPEGRYPAGVLRIPEPIAGTSFFPGSYGLWNPDGSRWRCWMRRSPTSRSLREG